MQEHLLSPYSSLQCTGSAVYGADKLVFRNWDPYVNRPMNLSEALATSCDTYFYQVGDRFYRGGEAARSRLQQWARSRLAPAGSASGARRLLATSCRHPPNKDASRATGDKAERAPIQLGHRAEGRHQRRCTAHYAMVATAASWSAYVVSGVERPGSNRREPVTVRQFPPVPAHAASARRPGRVPRTATHSLNGTRLPFGPSSLVPGGVGRLVVSLPGYPPPPRQSVVRLQAPDDAQLVVCAVIGSGGHGSRPPRPRRPGLSGTSQDAALQPR
jgi:hypothetical protein